MRTTEEQQDIVYSSHSHGQAQEAHHKASNRQGKN